MAAEEYRVKADELEARAASELDVFTRAEMQHLANSYRRLAEQADRNSKTDVVFEPPPLSGLSEQVLQQQQQPQPPEPSDDQ